MSFIAAATTSDRVAGLRRLCAVVDVVGAILLPASQYYWPLLSQAMDAAMRMKYESHTRVGTSKMRGGLTYLHALRQRAPQVRGVIATARGNHGQSIALAARRNSLAVIIVVPHDSSVEKNATMHALGVELFEVGEDFQTSRELADQLVAERGLHFVPSYHDDPVVGVASYWLGFFEVTPLGMVYVSIGMGLGIRVAIRACNALALSTHIVGVVSAHARYYEQSLKSGTVVSVPVSTLLADRLACRALDTNASEVIRTGIDEVITMMNDKIAQVICLYLSIIHNVTEGAAATALAGAWRQHEQIAGQRIGLSSTGDNIDHTTLARVLAGQPILP